MPRRYTESQLATVFARAQSSSWSGVLNYLVAHGGEAVDLTYDQLEEMKEDLEKMQDRAERFAADPQQAYQVIDAIQPAPTVFGPGSTTSEAEARGAE